MTIRVARSGDDLYVRSAHGPGNPWFRRAVAAGAGQARAGGDAALHATYDRFGPGPVGAITGRGTWAATLRLVPTEG